jgi:fructose-1,6-bisphosphatase/inositol monophosphatase family enzyme
VHTIISVAKPAFKNGDKLNIKNYRPISLLTAFSKVFEKIIYARLYQHLSQNDMLLKEQYVFRSKSSTKLASFKLTNKILLAMSNKLTGWYIL